MNLVNNEKAVVTENGKVVGVFNTEALAAAEAARLRKLLEAQNTTGPAPVVETKQQIFG